MVNGNDIIEFEEAYASDLMTKFITETDERNKEYWAFVEKEFSEYNAGLL